MKYFTSDIGRINEMAGKKNYPKNINVNLSPDVFEQLEVMAENDSCSLSSIARRLIETAIRDGKPQKRTFLNEMIKKEDN